MVFVSLIGPPELTAARAVHFAYATRIWHRGASHTISPHSASRRPRPDSFLMTCLVAAPPTNLTP